MDATLLSVQLLNGLQWGVLLFLIAAGLTLVFGLMDFINLAHGVQYVLGAYLCAAFLGLVGDFFAAAALALGVSLGVGWLLERLVLRKLYGRDHLYHVLATVGLIYFITEGIEILFGNALIAVEVPPLLHGEIPITAHFNYSLWRVAVIVVGLGVALALWWGATRTRVGQLVRAGADDAPMVAALGVDVQRLFAGVFAAGTALAALAGILNAPLLGLETTMGEGVLITSLVVIVIGGIGSIKGAFCGALLVGLVDTLGRAFATDALRWMGVDIATAATAGPALASMSIYLLMALVLCLRPQGLFPLRS